MYYTLLKGMVPTEKYEGIPDSDSRGKYIVFPLKLSDVILVSNFLRSEDGSMIQLKEQDYVKNQYGKIIACKYYY